MIHGTCKTIVLPGWPARVSRNFRAPMQGLVRSVVLMCLLPGVGCTRSPEPPAVATTQPYRGATLTLGELIGRLNARAALLPTLWASHYYEANLVDEGGKSTFVNGEGLLLYRSPAEFRLIGRKDVVGVVFDAGMRQDDVWLIVKPEVDTMWYGSRADLRAAEAQVPIRPDLLLGVLGVAPIEEESAPILRFNPDADAYMLLWIESSRGRSVAVQEMWYDRATLAPLLAVFYDEAGRPALRAYLRDHERVEVEGLAEQDQPIVARRYDLLFPENGSTMLFELDRVVLRNRRAPNDRTFVPPEPDRAGVSNVIRLGGSR